MRLFVPCIIENTPNCQPYPWHPSVLHLEKPFGGHCYWMAQTPLPPFEIQPYIDRYELPCIHYSDDGLDWKTIARNPIEDLTEEQIAEHDYFSDPHLVMKDGVLECYYRLTILKDRQLKGNKTLLYKKTSADGIVWSERKLVADLRSNADCEVWGEQIISPALVWKDGLYKCWYVDASSYVQGRNVRYVVSSDGINWKTNEVCNLNCKEIDPWHIDVQWFDGRYYMLVYDYYKLSLFVSESGETEFVYVGEVLRPSNNPYDFYADGLYRSCSVKTQDGYRVYFSARRKEKTYIGCLQTEDWLKYLGLDGQPFVGFMRKDIFPDMTRKEMLQPLKRRIKRALEKSVKKT